MKIVSRIVEFLISLFRSDTDSTYLASTTPPSVQRHQRIIPHKPPQRIPAIVAPTAEVPPVSPTSYFWPKTGPDLAHACLNKRPDGRIKKATFESRAGLMRRAKVVCIRGEQVILRRNNNGPLFSRFITA